MTMLSVVVPAYQEEATIVETLHRIQSVLDGMNTPYEIIVVSDGNTDKTAERAGEMASQHLRVLHYERNRGKGYALRHGAAAATGDLVAFIDGDLDIHPEGIVRFAELIEREGVDAVVASKTHSDSMVTYPLFRRVQSGVFRLLVRTFFSLDVSDTQTGLKLFRREVLASCLPHVTSDGFAFDLELLVLANDAGFRVIEGPVQLDFNFSSTTGPKAVVDVLREMVLLERNRVRQRRAHTWVERVSDHADRLKRKS